MKRPTEVRRTKKQNLIFTPLALLPTALILLTAVFLVGDFSMPDSGIEPYDNHSQYWQYEGNPVILLGGTDVDNLFQWPRSDLKSHLDTLKSAGGNYVRNVMSDDHDNKVGSEVYAFKEVDSGTYDLNQWNTEYWNRLRTLLEETSKRDIIVGIELWDRHDFEEKSWNVHPWNPSNNKNYTASKTTLNYKGDFWDTIPSLQDDQKVLQYQEKFVRRILDITFNYDNVVYIMMNESTKPREWSRYWADFVATEADNAGVTAYRAPMRNEETNTVDQYLNYPDTYDFADISQVNHLANQAHADKIVKLRNEVSDDPAPLNITKTYGGTKDASWYAEHEDEGAAKGWRQVFLGTASMRFHRPPWGIGLDTKAQQHLSAIRMVVDKLKPWESQLHQQAKSLLSKREKDETYILADPGRLYALYFPGDSDSTNDEPVNGDGTVTVDVSGISGDVRIRWYDIEADSVSSMRTSANTTVSLSRPDDHHWVAMIDKAGSNSARFGFSRGARHSP
jgi:hypothetical protein